MLYPIIDLLICGRLEFPLIELSMAQSIDRVIFHSIREYTCVCIWMERLRVAVVVGHVLHVVHLIGPYILIMANILLPFCILSVPLVLLGFSRSSKFLYPLLVCGYFSFFFVWLMFGFLVHFFPSSVFCRFLSLVWVANMCWSKWTDGRTYDRVLERLCIWNISLIWGVLIKKVFPASLA